jgi:hypothetical protein
MKLCLKARPTPAQLADRLRPVDGVWPDGLELYLAAADLADAATMEAIVERIRAARVPDGFAWLIEGPVDSLDGADFDVTRDSSADALVVERLAALAERIRAQAVNIHVIAPSPDLSRLSLACRAELLERSVPFLRRFAELMVGAGSVPTVENMPPVLRMRRADFAFTPIGMASEDLRWLAARVPRLRVLVDTSHAGLYLNARRGVREGAHAWQAPLFEYVQQLPRDALASPRDALASPRDAFSSPRDASGQPRDALSDSRDAVEGSRDAWRDGAVDDELIAYCQSLDEWLENAQISNAAGLLGEGLAFGEGELDLRRATRWLQARVRHVVAETLEPNHDDAVYMRDALRRMRAALA